MFYSFPFHLFLVVVSLLLGINGEIQHLRAAVIYYVYTADRGKVLSIPRIVSSGGRPNGYEEGRTTMKRGGIAPCDPSIKIERSAFPRPSHVVAPMRVLWILASLLISFRIFSFLCREWIRRTSTIQEYTAPKSI